MNNVFLKPMMLAFLLLCGTTAPVAAITISPAGQPYSYTVGDTIVVGNIDMNAMSTHEGMNAYYDFDGGSLSLRTAQIVSGNDRHGPLRHVKPEGISNREHYLSVYGHGYVRHPGSATFSFDQKVTTFAFTWGSIDRTNWLEVTNSKNDTYKITGADLMANIAGLGEGETVRHFMLTDLSGILKIVLRSCSDAFQVANVSISNVPLPAALPLFALGLVGLGVASRKKKA